MAQLRSSILLRSLILPSWHGGNTLEAEKYVKQEEANDGNHRWPLLLCPPSLLVCTTAPSHTIALLLVLTTLYEWPDSA